MLTQISGEASNPLSKWSMKVVILAGGLGTRLSEYTDLKPKPMVEVGDRPILWHIMKMYATAGWGDFIICGGYKNYVIKDFFANYMMHMADMQFDLSRRTTESFFPIELMEQWKVLVANTGDNTMTGGRVKRVRDYLDGEAFCLTYGDGVSDVDLYGLLQFHRSHGKLVTITAVSPPGRFGSLVLSEDGDVTEFEEKPNDSSTWINGGFMVCEQGVFDYIDGDGTFLEREPFERLCEDEQLMAYKHNGFWACMDTIRDKKFLDDLWASGQAPWKTW